MKIGFLSTVDPNDPDALSGMPAAMKRQLQALGADVVDLVPESTTRRPAPIRRLAGRLVRVARRFSGLGQGSANFGDPRLDDPDQAESVFLARATELSNEVAAQLEGHHFDLLFGCCVSTLLYHLETSVPIVYAGDTTARLINRDYPEFQDKPPGYHRATNHVEETGLRRVSQGIFATRLARTSAIEDYGLAPERAHVIPIGANIVPDSEFPGTPRECPTRSKLRLALTAIDPLRKQTDLAVEVAENMQARGWQAELTVIGTGTQRVQRSQVASSTGFLRATNPRHRVLHRKILSDCDLVLQPSLGEAFGLAPCEAAQWGVPSLVSGTGGLIEVIEHGETGLVLPKEADAAAYAEAISGLLERPEEYCRMSRAALKAAPRFTWESWAEQVKPHLESAVCGRKAADPVANAGSSRS